MAPLDLVLLLRPKQWTKNLLVFAAPLFVSDQLRPGALSQSFAAFAAMCLASGAIYAFNDLLDVGRDRVHPKKRHRPVASGRVGAGAAGVVGAVALVGGLALAASLGTKPLVVVLVYLGLQGLYILGAKRIPVTDVFLIGTGFVLRAALGAIAIHVQISAWLLLCTGALALLLGFGKRRSEFVLLGEARSGSRESLGAYSKQALDVLVAACATVAAICYGIYAVESPTAKAHPALILSSVFVFYGICRYLFLAFGADEGGEPETLLLKDAHLVASVLLFVVSVLLAFGGFSMGFVN